jgi:4-hydroxy-tetrahydrodipicolinate reductase
MPTTISINGASGRMGRILIRLAAADPALILAEALVETGSPHIGHDIVALSGAPEGSKHLAATTAHGPGIAVMIDFSLPAGLRQRLPECLARKTALVSGTTGLTADDTAALQAAAKHIPILHAANFSLGIAVLSRLAADAARLLDGYDIEITETHHRNKRDAPSGTANRLLRAVCDATARDMKRDTRHGRHGDDALRTPREIGMHAIRGGDVVGDHTVLFAGEGERIELTHKASSRECFAAGALRAAKWLAGRPPGLYSIEDVLFTRA